MTAADAIAYIEKHSWSTTRLGLERTRELLSRLGDPQKKLKFVHVAGSNGKGSVCAMLAAILKEAGYRTGLYTSPHLQDFCERIQVDGKNIPGEALAAVTQRVQVIADSMSDHPSQFELSTAIALVYFQERACDIVVLEVGMGGALDSTNAIDAPEVAVITNIGLEHTEYLGNTIEEIAAANAGIVKPGCVCVCYDCDPKARTVIAEICREKSVPLRRAQFDSLTLVEKSLDGQRFFWRDWEFTLPLLGNHQLHNAAVVLETVLALLRRGWCINVDAVHAGLAAVRWPARFEILNREPLFILDGGHNPQCAQALAETIQEYLPGEKVTFLLGLLADKDVSATLDILAPFAAEAFCVTPDSPRALPAEDLAEKLAQRGIPSDACGTAEGAIQAALLRGHPVISFGSLYLAGEIRGAFQPVYRKWMRKSRIAARDALSPQERAAYSHEICERILKTPAFQQAKTILIYRAVRGEVSLEELVTAEECADQCLVYPLCISKTEMIALRPRGTDAWKAGYCGIWEPVPEKSDLIDPKDIDLVVCPCTVFDDACHRMGMGAGFYDRYLIRCVNAKTMSVAFECQKAIRIPTAAWDMPMDMTVTEKGVYVSNPSCGRMGNMVGKRRKTK